MHDVLQTDIDNDNDVCSPDEILHRRLGGEQYDVTDVIQDHPRHFISVVAVFTL